MIRTLRVRHTQTEREGAERTHAQTHTQAETEREREREHPPRPKSVRYNHGGTPSVIEFKAHTVAQSKRKSRRDWSVARRVMHTRRALVDAGDVIFIPHRRSRLASSRAHSARGQPAPRGAAETRKTRSETRAGTARSLRKASLGTREGSILK